MKLRFTFWLDALLLAVFCVLEEVPFTGLLLHEWIGLASAVMVIVHLLVSWTWIATSTRRFLAASTRTRVNYVLNLTLFACMSILIFSGIIVSRYAIPAIIGHPGAGGAWIGNVQMDYQWGVIHNRFSTFIVIFAGLHLAINWDWSVIAARKIFGGAR